MTNHTKMLDCPSCGEPLIPASARGLFDENGEFCEHRDECGCPHCEPMWFDDMTPVECECGAAVGVKVDDGHAYACELTGDDD